MRRLRRTRSGHERPFDIAAYIVDNAIYRPRGKELRVNRFPVMSNRPTLTV